MKKKVKNGNRYCPKCHKYTIINKKQKRKNMFCGYSKKMSEYGYHQSTFWRNTKMFKEKNIFIPETNKRHLVIYLEMISCKKCSLFII